MSRLPQVMPRQMLAALQRGDFVIARSKGSHHFLIHKNDFTRRATVAMHTDDMPGCDVCSILKQSRLSVDDQSILWNVLTE